MPKIYHKRCVVCGVEFDTDIYNKSVCCEACFKVRLKKQRKAKPSMKKCIVCGKDFMADHGLINTCSDECKRHKKNAEWIKHRNKSRPILQRECKACGKIFDTTNNKKFTCSNKCRVINLRNNWSKLTAVKTMVVEAICPGCGKRHNKSIKAIDYGGVTPRYFCHKYPSCMGRKDNESFLTTYYESWQYENRGYI